jgi:hypothetical protein
VTEVLLLGRGEGGIREALLAYEAAGAALSQYDLREPYVDTLSLETISLGQAVALLNDLDWYLARVADEALIREPSVDEEEWLARPLAEAIRDGEIPPEGTGDHLKIFGIEEREPEDAPGRVERHLVEPMYVTRTNRGIPTYDLRDVEETMLVRVPASATPGR